MLLNCDYKIFSLIFAKCLKRGLNEIIGETQTGFMTNRHISSNIKLVLDIWTTLTILNLKPL